MSNTETENNDVSGEQPVIVENVTEKAENLFNQILAFARRQRKNVKTTVSAAAYRKRRNKHRKGMSIQQRRKAKNH